MTKNCLDNSSTFPFYPSSCIGNQRVVIKLVAPRSEMIHSLDSTFIHCYPFIFDWYYICIVIYHLYWTIHDYIFVKFLRACSSLTYQKIYTSIVGRFSTLLNLQCMRNLPYIQFIHPFMFFRLTKFLLHIYPYTEKYIHGYCSIWCFPSSIYMHLWIYIFILHICAVYSSWPRGVTSRGHP